MARFITILFTFLVSIQFMEAKNHIIIIADSISHEPLSSVSMLDRKGNAIGKTDNKGALSSVSISQYPLTVRAIGYN